MLPDAFGFLFEMYLHLNDDAASAIGVESHEIILQIGLGIAQHEVDDGGQPAGSGRESRRLAEVTPGAIHEVVG